MCLWALLSFNWQMRCRCGSGVSLQVMFTKKKNVTGVFFIFLRWRGLVLKKKTQKTPGPSIKTQAHLIACFSTSPPAPRVCLLWNVLAIITPFISYDGSGTWKMYTRTLCGKWNGQDMKGMAVIEKLAYLVSTKGKGWARGRQMYLVSSQTLGRRWWSARGSWQVLNLSLLSFRQRGCDTTAQKAGNSWCEINEWQLGHNRWRRKYEK